MKVRIVNIRRETASNGRDDSRLSKMLPRKRPPVYPSVFGARISAVVLGVLEREKCCSLTVSSVSPNKSAVFAPFGGHFAPNNEHFGTSSPSEDGDLVVLNQVVVSFHRTYFKLWASST